MQIYVAVVFLSISSSVSLKEDWTKYMDKLECDNNDCLYAIFATFDGDIINTYAGNILSLCIKDQIKQISSTLNSNPQLLADTGITIPHENEVFTFACDSVEKDRFLGHLATGGIVFANTKYFAIMAINSDLQSFDKLVKNVDGVVHEIENIKQ